MKILKVGNVDVLLDDWDWLRLCRYKWRVKKVNDHQSYIVRTEGRKGFGRKRFTVYMHRVIMDTPEGLECHHKNGKTFDNRTENLENLTKQEHMKKDRERLETNNKPSI